MRYARIPSAVRWPYMVILLCVLFAFGLFVPGNGAARAPNASGATVSADITSDTTWTRANSPYLVTLPIRVANTATLTIEPGVEVHFGVGAGLQIEGGLNSQGTHAQQVRMVGDNSTLWQGLVVVQPTRNVLLQSVTISNAVIGLAIRQQSLVATQASGRVDLRDSLFEQNNIGLDADYSVATNTPRLTLRNSLFTNNGIGLRLNGLPGSNIKPKFNHNSFVGNGIGALNLSAQAFNMQQQWWGSASGPQLDTSACDNPPVPGTAAVDLVCGTIDFTPWVKVPAGRILLPASQDAALESALGAAALGDNDVAATSVMTVTVPAGTFTQTVDLLASVTDFTSTPPGQPTLLEFELTAAASGQEVHRFANNQQLTVDILYTDADLAGADPRKLVVYAYDETLGAWSFAGISTTVDPANHHIVVRLEHLSRFSVTSVNMQNIMLPLIMR